MAVLCLLAAVHCLHSFQNTVVPTRRQILFQTINIWSVYELPRATLAVSVSPLRSSKSHSLLTSSSSSAAAASASSASTLQNSASSQALEQRKRRIRPVALTHERDFFRQAARLESMDSYLLVSTLTASMSFGALLGFQPSVQATAAWSTLRVLGYRLLCSAIPVIAGFSALFGLYATIIFSLTVLYGKSKCGAKWDNILISTLPTHTDNTLWHFSKQT
jgi:hypothetical protein